MSASSEDPSLPQQFNFAQDVLARRACEMPSATAVIGIRPDGEMDKWSFKRMATASSRLAGAMLARGLVKGDRVLIFMPRTPYWHVAMCACLHAGLIPVPCVTQITESELAYRRRICNARGVISSAEFLDRVEGCTDQMLFRAARLGGKGWLDLESLIRTEMETPPYAPMPASTPALIYFTSGSSGPPKAIVHSALGIAVRGTQPWRTLGMRRGDVIWNAGDMGWTRASACLLFGPWLYGACALVVEGTLSPSDRMDVIAEQEVAFYCAVSTDLRQIMAQAAPRALPKLRWTHSAGEAMTAELVRSWRAFSGAPLVVGYGQTETPSATLSDPMVEPVNGMIGRPLSGNHIGIIDAHGALVPPGVEGEIAFASTDPGLYIGHWTDSGLVAPERADNWHHTGDIGRQERSGEIFFVGRADDIISSSGYRIGPTEVENALLQHPSVADCAVAASPDEERGEVVKAFILLRKGFSASPGLINELQQHTKSLIAPYKYPRRIAFVEALPKTASGKVSRRALREAEFLG